MISADLCWLSNAQFAKIWRLLPTQTRSVKRVDNRRVISGIIHILKSGCRWIEAPSEYGPRKTLYNRFVRWADKGVWVALFEALALAGGPKLQLMIDPSAVRAQRSAAGRNGGEKNQAIGPSRGERTTKIHAPTDEYCRPLAFLITGDNVADCIAATSLLERLPHCDVFNGDKGDDHDALREQIRERDALACVLAIPRLGDHHAPPSMAIAKRIRCERRGCG